MKKYIPLDFDEKGKVILGNAKNTPTQNGTIPAIFIPGGSDENKQGLKSISISPAIQTTPALDSLFPIYWDDLPEGEIEEGVEYREHNATLHTGHALTPGDQYSFSITPTSEWHYDAAGVIGGDGETVTVTQSVISNKLTITAGIFDHENVKSITATILITE